MVEAAAFLAFAGALAGGFGAPGALAGGLAGGLAGAAFVGLGLPIAAIAAASPSNADGRAPDSSKATFFDKAPAADFSPTSAGFFDVLEGFVNS